MIRLYRLETVQEPWTAPNMAILSLIQACFCSTKQYLWFNAPMEHQIPSWSGSNQAAWAIATCAILIMALGVDALQDHGLIIRGHINQGDYLK